MLERMAAAVIRTGTCFALYALEAGQGIDLDRAERRLAAAERQRVKAPRRAPAFFAYEPAPLRVTVPVEPVIVGAAATAATADVVLYDFGAVSVSLALPLAGPLAAVPALAAELYGNERLAALARAVVERLSAMLGDAIARPHVAAVVEDYPVFVVAELVPPLNAAALIEGEARTVAQLLRAEPLELSAQEIADAVSHRISFGPDDVTVVDGDAALVYDREAEDVRAVLEFANVQLLEMRFLDAQLDRSLDRAYEELARGRRPGLSGPDLRRLSRQQIDAAVLFEQVSNAVKLIGDQYLARVYGMAGRRFHLSEWDAAIARKLQTMEGIYAKLTDRAADRRMEMLEWIIIVLIAVSIVLPFLGK